MIVGIIGGIVALIIIVIVIYCIWKKNKKAKEENEAVYIRRLIIKLGKQISFIVKLFLERDEKSFAN